ncbi:MAG: hypothetical protein AB9846_17985 [Tenuifilaceae bacterium]
MKYKLLIFFSIYCFATKAQLIHVDGSKSVGLNFGYTKYGYSLSARLTLYQKGKIAYRGNIDFETVNFPISKVSCFTANPELMYTVKSLGDKFFISAKVGLIAGAEFLSNSILNKKKNQFVIGENIGICAEYFLGNRFMINIDLDQRFFQLSKVGEASFVSKIGININF